MEFSTYQLERIARFAAASESLHQNRLLLTTPGMTRPALALAMRAKKRPDISENALNRAVDAFRELCQHSERSRRLRKMLPVFFALAAICGAFTWGRIGPASAIAVSVAIVLAAVAATFGFRYLSLQPILRRFQLTREEAVFALDDVIADPRWQSDRE